MKNSPEIKLENNVVQFLNVNEAKLALDYYCACENPTQLLVLINGFQRNRQDFRAFRKKLPSHIATVAFDNRCCGETILSENGNCSMELMAQDAKVICEIFMQLGNFKFVSILGISMGGMIAQTLATICPPNFIHNLFLVSTTAGGKGRTWLINAQKNKYENTNTNLESTKKNMTRYFGSKFLKSSPLLFEMMCKNLVQSKQDEKETLAQLQFNASSQFDITNQLNEITVNNLVVISGDEDHIIPLENAIFLNQQLINSHLIIYPNVGHLILIEAPNLFVQDVSKFLTK